MRKRARELGIAIGPDPTGTHNAITDVAGVRVGHVTLISGDGPLRIGHGPVRTGVTAILPPGENWYDEPVETAQFVFNGAGTTAGLSLIDEFGRIETPVLLTNSLSVGTVYEGIVRYMVERIFAPRGRVPWFNPVVGETSDTYLNDMGGLHVRPEHAMEAIATATGGPVQEGSVGAGTGTSAFGFKGGIGTSSREVQIGGQRGVIAVLVQSNFGGAFTVAGVSMAELRAEAPAERQSAVRHTQEPLSEAVSGSSIMMVVGTDLPLSSRLLGRVARRATFGLARTGSRGGHGSGDYVIAFSTTYRQPGAMPVAKEALAADESLLDGAFGAVADATEEAILNSIFMAERVVGRDGHVREAFPIERMLPILRRHGVIE